MKRRHISDEGAKDHPTEQSDSVVYVRYRQPDDGEWEETCLQFQGDKGLLERVRQELEKLGHRCRKSAECLFTEAERASVDSALRRAGYPVAQVVDVAAPAAIPETDEA